MNVPLLIYITDKNEKRCTNNVTQKDKARKLTTVTIQLQKIEPKTSTYIFCRF
jgi:hypothetical protein